MEDRGSVMPQIEQDFQFSDRFLPGFQISVSIGVACCPENGENYEVLFHCADQALYSAKRRMAETSSACMTSQFRGFFLSVLFANG